MQHMQYHHETNERIYDRCSDSPAQQSTLGVSAFCAWKAPPQYIASGGANRPPPFSYYSGAVLVF